MPRELRDELSKLADEDWIQELANDDVSDHEMGYNMALSAIIPEDAQPLGWDMVSAHGIDEKLHDRIMELAGPNVSAHDVIRHYVNEAKQKHAKGEWIPNGGAGDKPNETDNHE